MDDRTGAQLDDHEVRTYLEFAGERAYITSHEMVNSYALGVAILLFGSETWSIEVFYLFLFRIYCKGTSDILMARNRIVLP